MDLTAMMLHQVVMVLELVVVNVPPRQISCEWGHTRNTTYI